MKNIRMLLLTLLAVVIVSVGLTAPAGATAPQSLGRCQGVDDPGITDVVVTEKKITVTGAVADPCPLIVQIRAVLPSGETDVNSGDFVALTTPESDGSFTATFSRFRGSRDRAYSRFIAVAYAGGSTEVIGAPAFAVNLDYPSANTDPRRQPESMKGISVTMTSDAQEVGAEHAAVSVALNDLLLKSREPGAIPFSSGRKTYYFDAEFVHALDGQIRSLSDQGMLVYLVFVLTYEDAEQNPNSSFPLLVHPDAPEGEPAFFMTYAFDTVTEEGIAAYTAVTEFVASRYTRDDQAYGRAMDYIVGNEIDSAGVWHAMGDKTLDEFLDAYIPALRIAWQASQKYHADARVYTSLDHFWNENANPADPTHFYNGKDVLDGLAAKIREQGDFDWNLAQHPYPNDMMDPRVWDDPVTDDPDETGTITFKNIATLTDYMTRPELTYEGAPRHVILSELGCQSPTNDHADQVLQAACMAYSYYKVSAAGGVDAFIWDPQVDNQEAGGLRMGLWSYDPARTDSLNAPGEKKLSYDLYRGIDTPESLELSEFALEAIGIDGWNDVIPNFDASMIAPRHTMTPVGMEIGATSASDTSFGFEKGEDGWGPADHVVSASSVRAPDAAEGGRVLDVNFDDVDVMTGNAANDKTWRGASVGYDDALDASATPYLRASIRLDPAAASDLAATSRLSAQVRVTAEDGSVAYGLARIDPEGWNTVHLDLSGWDKRGAISRVTVWAHGTSGQDWRGAFQLDDVGFASEVSAGEKSNLDIRAVAADHDAVGAPIDVTVANDGAAPLAGQATATACGDTAIADPVIDVEGVSGAGGTAVHSTTMTALDPDDPVLCIDYAGATYRVVVEIPPAGPNLVYDFEEDAQGWTAGTNVDSVAQVSSFPNGPQSPHSGHGALEALMSDTDAAETRTMEVSPDEPLDLTEATELYAWVDAYGGIPGATGYEATLTVFDGEDSRSVTSDGFVPDSWNELRIDLRDWDGRSHVTRMEVSYRVLGADGFVWTGNPRMQVDDIGIVTDDDAPPPVWNAAWAAPIGGHYPGESIADVTYRQMAQASTDGTAVRLRLTNAFGETPLGFDAASVGIRDGDTAGTVEAPRAVTIGGQTAFEVPVGESVYTDPVRLDIRAGEDLVISTHSADELPELSHDFANKTHFVSGPGDHTGEQSADIFAADGTSTLWVDAIDVYGATASGTVAILGDSITDGAGSDVDADNRWPNLLAERLHAQPHGSATNLAVVNAGIGGNTLAGFGNEQVGENGLARLDRDVLSQAGLRTAVVFEATNDIYMGASVDEVTQALTEAAERIHDAGVRAVICTAVPRGNGIGWTDEMETKRAAVNEWIRAQTVYDAVIDTDPVLADPDDPTVMRADLDADGTHPNAAGHRALAEAVDLSVLAVE